MLALIFDTETTGLAPKGIKSIDDMLLYFPYIVQISFILLNCNTLEIVESHDYIIKVPDSVEISAKSTEIHGIDRKISNEKGIDIKEALVTFDSTYDRENVVVGHNMDFDIEVVQIESLRNEFGTIINKNHVNKKFYCTMRNSINLCGLIGKNSRGLYKKYPKQFELHKKLFGTEPKNLHNSYNDILVCLRCYVKLEQNKDICEYNEEIKNIYSKLLEV